MRPWRSPARRWAAKQTLALGLLVGLGAAFSQAVSPVSGPCALSDQVLEVHMGAAVRGTQLVKSDSTNYWVERAALQPGEEGYADGRISCDGTEFLHLRPELRPSINQASLSLLLQPAPQLLSTQMFGVKALRAAGLTSQPLFSLDYALTGGLAAGGSSWQGASLVLNYVDRSWRASAGVVQVWDSEAGRGLSILPSALVRYQGTPYWGLQAQYNRPTHPVFGTSYGGLGGAWTDWKLLSGLSADFSSASIWYWPRFEAELDLPAVVRLSVDGQLIEERQAGPGPVVWTQVPLRHSRGSMTLEITDAAGTRTVRQDYAFPDHLLPKGTFDSHLAAGWQGGQVFAGVAGAVGVTPGLTLQGKATVHGQELQGEIWGVTAPGQQDLRLGVSASKLGDHWQGAGHLRFQGSVRGLALGLQADLPFDQLSRPTLAASVSQASERYTWSIAGGYDWQANKWLGRAEAGVTLKNLDLRGVATVHSGGWGAGINLIYRPNDRLSIRTGSSYSPAFGSYSTASVGYQISPAQRVQLDTDFRTLSGQYQYADRTNALLSVSSGGSVLGAVRGSVIWTGGTTSLSQNQASGVYLQVRTGVPHMALYAGGLYQGQTDDRGDLLITSQPQDQLRLSLRVNTLPIEVDVKADQLDLSVPQEGSYLVDWRDNFRVMQWVQVTWDGQEAAQRAELHLSGDVYPTDRDGYALLPATLKNRPLTLLDPATGRTCTVRWSGQELVSCTP